MDLLERHKGYLDLSSVDLDGSHTPAIRGGEYVEYQGRKKGKTTNALYLNDRQGIPLACAAKEIKANVCFNKRNGNADDRDEYFDKELYEERYAVERTNAPLFNIHPD